VCCPEVHQLKEEATPINYFKPNSFWGKKESKDDMVKHGSFKRDITSWSQIELW